MNGTEALHKSHTLILIGALAALTVTVACSDDNKSVVQAADAKPHSVDLRPASSAPVKPVSVPVIDDKSAQPSRSNGPKFLSFNSRDYGVSLAYPWQYTALRSKTIADNESFQPKSDGSESQFSLVRIEVPKGFYPDTDLDSAYLTISLNQDIDEGQCKAMVDKDKAQAESINGVEFFWNETTSSGRGSASRIRNYITYQNDTCYEIEMGVKTKNDHGLSKEVNTNQVMARLDSLLKSVKIKLDENNQEQKLAEGKKPVPKQ